MAEKTILLVEDNPDDEALILRAWERNATSARLVVARDGAEALAYLFGGTGGGSCRKKIVPDVILLDLKLPKVDGLEVLRRLRADERTKLIPVVILSSSSERKDLVGSYDLGANSYVRKPVDFREFVGVVQHVRRYWVDMNQSPPTARAT